MGSGEPKNEQFLIAYSYIVKVCGIFIRKIFTHKILYFYSVYFLLSVNFVCFVEEFDQNTSVLSPTTYVCVNT